MEASSPDWFPRLGVSLDLAGRAAPAAIPYADPQSFTTTRTFNADGLVTEEIGPGRHFRYTYATANPDCFQHGNLLKSSSVGPMVRTR
jgi:hypothetical protein